MRKKVYLGRDLDGVVRTTTVTAPPGKIDAEIEKRKKEFLNANRVQENNRATFGEYRQLYLSEKQETCGAKEYKSIKGRSAHWAAFDNRPIQSISASDCKQQFAQIIRDGKQVTRQGERVRIGDYSHKTLAYMKKDLVGIFNQAIDDRLIDFNPGETLKLTNRGTPKQERTPIEPQQINWVIELKHPAQTSAMLALFGGLRRGEIMALKWEDIDYKKHYIRIRDAADTSQSAHSVSKGSTKTDAGKRNAPMPPVLERYLKRQHKTGAYVANNSDNMLSSNQWESMWKSYMSHLDYEYGQRKIKPKNIYAKGKNVIAPFTAHMLRHTAITLWYFAHIDVLQSQIWAGHKSAQVTQDIYTHLQQDPDINLEYIKYAENPDYVLESGIRNY